MHVQQVAMAHQLGLFRRRYTSVFGGAIAGIVAGLIFVYIGVYTATTSHDGTETTFGLVITLIALSITVFSLNNAVQLIGRRVYLFQQGLIIQDRGKIQVFPWSQIAEVSESITPHSRKKGLRVTPTYKYTLRRVDGYQITLDNTTKNIAFLGPIVARAVAPDPVSHAMHSIRAGQTLTFAQFSIN